MKNINLLYILLCYVFFSCTNISEKDIGKKTNNILNIKNKELLDSINILLDYGAIPNSVQGESAYVPREFLTMKWIISNASTEELHSLIEHPNGVLKGLGFKGILKKNSPDIYITFLKALDDDSTNVYNNLGCDKFGGYCFNELTKGVTENLSLYFNQDQIYEIKKRMKGNSYICD